MRELPPLPRLIWGVAMAAALLGLTLLAFSERLSPGEAVGGHDDLAEHDLPLAALHGRSLDRGELARWNPHKGLGVPAAEAPFMGPYYPGFLLYRWFSPGVALNLGFLGHIFLSGLFMLLLCRALGAGGVAAWVGAASWILSSVFRLYSHEGWLPETVAVCYLPGACYLLLGLCRASTAAARTRWLVAASFSLALMVLGGHPSYALVTLSLALIFGLVSARAWRVLPLVLASFALGAALSSPAWGPLLHEGSLMPHRALGELGKMSASTFSPEELFNYLVPDQGEARLHFVGRPLLLLGLAGALLCGWSRRWGVPALLVCGGFLAINTLGSATRIPVLNLVSVPGTWHVGVVLALAAGGAVALHGLGLLLARRPGGRWAAPLVLLSLATLQLADLAVYQASMPRRQRQPVADFFGQGPFNAFLARDPSLFRVVSFPEESPLWRINQGTFTGVDCYNARIKGVGVHRLNGNPGLSSEVENELDLRLMRLINVKYWLITRPELKWDEARHPPGYELALKQRVTVGGPGEERQVLAVVLRQRDPFPRAFLLGGPGQLDLEPLLLGVAPDPLQRLNISDGAWSLLEAHTPVRVRRQGARYLVEYTAAADGLLFLGEMFHPGWTATLDGRPAQVISPLTVFVGARAPAGKHRVVFEFRPPYLYKFWLLSLAAAAVAVGLLIWGCYRNPVSAQQRST